MEFTVLGLLGPAGSGKDLVGDFFVKKGFAKVAYADPMKRFVRDAFGFSEEQLWGASEERNREMDVAELWWFNAVTRLPGAADEILNDVLPVGIKVPGYLKLMEWFSWLRKNHSEKLSARVVLQTLGTEWGREVDPLLWIRYGHLISRRLSEGDCYYTQSDGLIRDPHPQAKQPNGVIIPDHRFVNEVEYTQENGGYVIRLIRLAQEAKTVGIEGHKSEAEQKGMQAEHFDLNLEVDDFDVVKNKDGETVLTSHAQQDFERSLNAVYEEELWMSRKRGVKGPRYRISPTVGKGGAPPSS